MKYFTSILTSAILYLLIIVNVHGQSITFDKPIDVSQGVVSGVSALDVADLNGDALMDVIVLEGGVHAEGRFTLAWFEQTKKGKWIKHDFNIPVKFDDFIGSARCDDMDNDGDMDLVFSNDGHGSGPINVYLLINPGKKKVYNQWEHALISTINGFHAIFFIPFNSSFEEQISCILVINTFKKSASSGWLFVGFSEIKIYKSCYSSD